MSYLSASEVVIHYEEALYQLYAPLPRRNMMVLTFGKIRGLTIQVF